MNLRRTGGLGARLRGSMIAVLMAFAVISILGSPAWAQSAGGGNGDTNTPSGVGMQAAAWAASIPYGAAKVAYAISGGIIGGITYVLSGGNLGAANAVWIPSLYGNYFITPAQLRGQEPLHFVGSQAPAVPPAAQATPAPGGAQAYPLEPQR